MTAANDRGLTLVEILVAIVILGVGLLMLAGGSLVVTRDLTRSSLATLATARANAKLDELRVIAASTVPSCTSGQFVSSPSPQTVMKITLQWTISPSSGAQRTAHVITAYTLPGGRTHTDTLRALIGC